MAVRREYIADLYRNVLGREGSDGEISGWENSPDEQSVANMFYGSPEYTSKNGGNASWQDVGGQITPVSNPSSPSYQTQSSESDPGWPGGTIYPTTPTTTPGTKTAVGGTDANSMIADLYRKYLGRDPVGDDATKWLSGAYGWGDANNIAGIERGIQTSEEASRRRAATPTTSYSATPYSNFQTGGNDYSAFNTGRLQDPGKSAKDAFAMISNQAPPPPFGDRNKLTTWFNTYIKPGMDALGHKVISVNGDSFTYSNGEGTFTVDFAQNAGATPGSMLQRLQWGATPADAATAARYAGSGTTVGTTGNTARPTSAPSSTNYAGLGQYYGGPGGAGVFNGPLQQVGQDPLSQLITGGLADFLNRGGTTPFGSKIEDYVLGQLGMGGNGSSYGGGDMNGIEPWMMGGGSSSSTSGPAAIDQGRVNSRFESARELMDKGRRTMMNDTRGELANRGLLSEPGIPQGAEIGAVKRIEESIAPEFSRALRDIYTDESTKADAKQLGYLQLATGLSTDQAKQFLAGIGEGTARQTALANIALQSLSQNMAWSQFLAEFGLKRDQVLNQMQNGNVDDVMQLLNSFLSLASLSRGGYVGA